MSLYQTLFNDKSVTGSGCTDALQRYACVTAFPACPIGSNTPESGYAYLPPCELQCLQAQSICQSSFSCSGLPSINCVLKIPSTNFVLSPQQVVIGACMNMSSHTCMYDYAIQLFFSDFYSHDICYKGPYESLGVLYPIIVSLWGSALLLWMYLAFYKYRLSSVALSRYLTVVPFLKSFTLIFATSFWVTCVSQQMCNFSLSVAYTNCQLIYESVTRQRITIDEWRSVIVFVSCFYMFSSLLVVLETTVLDDEGYWIIVGVLYGSMYLYIFQSLVTEVRKVQSHVKLLHPNMSASLTAPLREKHLMYEIFLVCTFTLFSVEVTAHAMVAEGVPYQNILFLYEISNFLLNAIIGYLFRPREYSPFFFMVPAQASDVRTRYTNLPISRLIAVRGPDESLTLGVMGHPTANHDA
ncbi:unnamed protein product [Sphagnum balticum]